jgi:hypothetical protein
MQESLAPIDLHVVVDTTAPPILDDAVTFETGSTRAQVGDPGLYAYNHHGPGFGVADPGALTSLVFDILQGRPLPLKFVCREVHVDTLVAVSVFLRRNLCLSDRLIGFVAEVDAAHRLGPSFLAHLDTRVCQFLRHLEDSFPSGLSRSECGRRLRSAVEWIEGYLSAGTLPSMRHFPRDITLIEHGTEGFGMFQTPHAPLYGWIEAFRRGYLRGAVQGAGGEVWLGRKSPYVPFDLDRGSFLLTEREGRPWVRAGEWVRSPEGGTSLGLSDVLPVLVQI